MFSFLALAGARRLGEAIVENSDFVEGDSVGQISKISSPGLEMRLFSSGLTTATLASRGLSLSDWKIRSYSSNSPSSRNIKPLLFVGLPASSTGLSSTARRAVLPRKGGSFSTKTPGKLVLSLAQSAPVFRKDLSFSSNRSDARCRAM